MLVTLLGMVMLAKLLQSEKAPVPMPVTPSAIFTLVKVVSFSFANETISSPLVPTMV